MPLATTISPTEPSHPTSAAADRMLVSSVTSMRTAVLPSREAVPERDKAKTGLNCPATTIFSTRARPIAPDDPTITALVIPVPIPLMSSTVTGSTSASGLFEGAQEAAAALPHGALIYQLVGRETVKTANCASKARL
jgi:hypothetical protein